LLLQTCKSAGGQTSFPYPSFFYAFLMMCDIWTRNEMATIIMQMRRFVLRAIKKRGKAAKHCVCLRFANRNGWQIN